ncbi:MAG TPA: imidazole glycerol phosphate synthase subunit HisH [Chitinophagaceae bacterium]|nr:imidazole glycerol phosphate synthase subunit HisH [Chitinophagaceae bacterium]
MPVKTIIINCREGNVNSVQKMMSMISPGTKVTDSPGDILGADKIILPGIGHFQKAMEALNRYRLIEPLNEAVLVKKKPILGICLGMQIMAGSSEEGSSAGLGWLNGEVLRFKSSSRELKIPHMGWNTVDFIKQSLLNRDIPDGSEFYFAHSFHWRSRDRSEILGETEYGTCFPSAIEKENIFGVQFHPEKSHDGGMQLLRNFATL